MFVDSLHLLRYIHPVLETIAIKQRNKKDTGGNYVKDSHFEVFNRFYLFWFSH